MCCCSSELMKPSATQGFISHLFWFLRGLSSAAKTYSLVDGGGLVFLRSGFLCSYPSLFLHVLLVFLFALIYVSKSHKYIKFLFDCLGHTSNFCFLLLSASSGEMCTQRQKDFQSRLHPHFSIGADIKLKAIQLYLLLVLSAAWRLTSSKALSYF